MRQFQASDRYMRSFLELAEAKGKADALISELESLGQTVRKHPRLMKLLQNPLVNRREKHGLIQKAANQKMSPLVDRFLMLLVDKRRIDLFPLIVERVREVLNEKLGIQEATVVSAHKLDSQSSQGLKKVLETITNKKIVLETQTDPDLLGGVQVKLGNRLIDGSLRTRLEALRTQLQTAKV